MTTLAIVAGGVCGYSLAASYVYLRLLWYFKQTADRYSEPDMAAFLAAMLLPLGLALLLIRATGVVEKQGIPPRSVRRERTLKQQREEIARLERELGIPS